MKTTLGAALAVLSGITLASVEAAAMNLSIDEATIDEAGNLSLEVSEIFMPRLFHIEYVSSARAEATYMCVTSPERPVGGRRHQRTVRVVLDDRSIARANIEGDVRATLTLRVEDEQFNCPGRSYAQLTRVVYTSILVQRLGAFTTATDVERVFASSPSDGF